MKKFLCAVSLCIATFRASAGPALHAQEAAPPAQAPAHLGTEAGYGVFEQNCMACHGNPDAPVPAPSPAALRLLSPEKIYDALTNGVMRIQGQSLTDEQKRRVAESVSGSSWAAPLPVMRRRCRTGARRILR